jgi:hypothetical protein
MEQPTDPSQRGDDGVAAQPSDVSYVSGGEIPAIGALDAAECGGENVPPPAECRICLQSLEDDAKLVEPCACAGTRESIPRLTLRDAPLDERCASHHLRRVSDSPPAPHCRSTLHPPGVPQGLGEGAWERHLRNLPLPLLRRVERGAPGRHRRRAASQAGPAILPSTGGGGGGGPALWGRPGIGQRAARRTAAVASPSLLGQSDAHGDCAGRAGVCAYLPGYEGELRGANAQLAPEIGAPFGVTLLLAVLRVGGARGTR